MVESKTCGAERAIRWTTTVSVVVLAMIAALGSYKHMFLLVRRYGEESWTAALLPVSVDGMIAGWPSCALIGSYELFMGQIRHTAVTAVVNSDRTPMRVLDGSSEAVRGSEVPRSLLVGASEQAAGAAVMPSHGLEEVQRRHRVEHSPTAAVAGRRGRSRSGHAASAVGGGGSRRGDEGIRRRAWQWAVANRTPEGELPAGKVIAGEYGRSERWGRLVKQAGLAGELV
jgi:hypothetical protein